MTGTAAVTLAGLLFVALSFNLDTLLHDSKVHVLAHARQTLMSFIYALIVSLLFLVPFGNPRIAGLSVMLTSIVMLVTAIPRLKAGLLSSAEEIRFTRRRGIMFLVAYIGIGMVGALLFFTRVPEMAYWMIGFMCLLLGNAAGASWDLLVQVGRLKAAPHGK